MDKEKVRELFEEAKSFKGQSEILREEFRGSACFMTLSNLGVHRYRKGFEDFEFLDYEQRYFYLSGMLFSLFNLGLIDEAFYNEEHKRLSMEVLC